MKIIAPFEVRNKLVTNEFAHWNPTNVWAPRSRYWRVSSGSLFMKDEFAWTGVPDGVGPNIDSTNGNNSAIFRMETLATNFQNMIMRMKVFNEGLTQTVKTPPKDWDGFHIWPRYVDEAKLYVVSVNRRSNSCVIKKKLPGGPNPSNGGTYYPLTRDVPFQVPYKTWQDIYVEVKTLPEGSVALALGINDKPIVSAIDNGLIGGPAIIEAGRVGLRGDNANLMFDKISFDDLMD